jgi:hypothetical protein
MLTRNVSPTPSLFKNSAMLAMVRMNRWAKNGVPDRVLEKLQSEQIVRIRIEAFALNSTPVWKRFGHIDARFIASF